MARSTKARDSRPTDNKNPSTTKARSGRFHKQGHKKAKQKPGSNALLGATR